MPVKPQTEGMQMTEQGTFSVWRVVQATAVVVVMGFFLFETLTVLNPALLFVLLWAVLLPFRGRQGYAVFLSIAAGLTLVWVLSTTGSILSPFILAVVLAYVLDPLVDRLERRGLSRSVAVLALILPSVGLLALLLFVFVPAAFEAVGELLGLTPVLFERLGDWYEASQERLLKIDVPFFDGAEIVAELRAVDADRVVAFLQERQAAFTTYLWEGVLGLGRGLGSALAILGYVVLTPVLSYYLIRDWDQVIERVLGLIPPGHREAVVSFGTGCDQLVSSYMRGQLTVAAVIGLLTGVGFTLLNFPYAASLGLVAGVFSIVPYLGVIITLIPAIFIALVSGNVVLSLVKVAVLFGVVQLLDQSVISPRIVGDSVGIHPVWVVLAMTMGGYFFGVVGLLVAVPAAAIIKMLVGRGIERYLASDFYLGTEQPAPSDPR
jgi:predicted PurR-regulated permease PerM